MQARYQILVILNPLVDMYSHLSRGVNSWKSSKQTCRAHSTMVAEFIALEKPRVKAEWLWNLYADMSILPKLVSPVSLHCDNIITIARAENKTYNGKNRHIRLRHNVVRQLIRDDVIALNFVRSEMNLTYPLTKPLTKNLVFESLRGMG